MEPILGNKTKLLTFLITDESLQYGIEKTGINKKNIFTIKKLSEEKSLFDGNSEDSETKEIRNKIKEQIKDFFENNKYNLNLSEADLFNVIFYSDSNGTINLGNVSFFTHDLCDIFLEAKNEFLEANKEKNNIDQLKINLYFLCKNVVKENDNNDNVDNLEKFIIENNDKLFEARVKNTITIGGNNDSTIIDILIEILLYGYPRLYSANQNQNQNQNQIQIEEDTPKFIITKPREISIFNINDIIFNIKNNIPPSGKYYIPFGFLEEFSKEQDLKTQHEKEKETIKNLLLQKLALQIIKNDEEMKYLLLGSSNQIKQEKVSLSRETTKDYLGELLLLCINLGKKNHINHLLKLGADINYKNPFGLTALMIVVANGYEEIVEMFLEHLKLNFTDDVVKDYIDEQKNKSGDNALIIAVRKGNTKILEMLLEAGANPDLKNLKSPPT
jgi:hypothetical protein